MFLISEVTATGLVTISCQFWQPSLKLVHGIGRTEKLKHSNSGTVSKTKSCGGCLFLLLWGGKVLPGEHNHLLRLLHYCLTQGHVCGDFSIRLFSFFLFDFSLGGMQPLSQDWFMDLLTLVSTVHIGWV